MDNGEIKRSRHKESGAPLSLTLKQGQKPPCDHLNLSPPLSRTLKHTSSMYCCLLSLFPLFFGDLGGAATACCSLVCWTASRGPRRGRLHWWRMWPGCTTSGSSGCAGRACLSLPPHSWRLADLVKINKKYCQQGIIGLQLEIL